MRLSLRSVRLIMMGLIFSLAVRTMRQLLSAHNFFDALDARNVSFISPPSPKEMETRCALLFFGLPRSYETIVLPSIVENVLIPNRKYNCDVYAHSVITETEEPGKSGMGGTIDPEAIFLLKERVNAVAAANSTSRIPHVAIATDSEQDFWRLHNTTLDKFHNTKALDGKPLYYPWKARMWTPKSVDNVVKAWHSIQTVWELMDTEASRQHVTYDRVGMLRSDVLYVTPIDIYQTNKTATDPTNMVAVLPGFARYPVNDRMIYGPYNAVKIWATERFLRIDDQVRNKVERGYGIHSERFINDSIVPAIVKEGTQVVTNPDICFFRVRADETIWISDCNPSTKLAGVNKQIMVERILGRPCIRSKFSRAIIQLACHSSNQTNNKTDY